MLIGLCIGSTDSTKVIPPYERGDWMPSWSVGTGLSCLNVRELDLVARGEKVTFNGKCSLIGGIWDDAYSDSVLSVPTKIDIDHIVSLKDAHMSGGYKWGRAERLAFAYDTSNHAITSASLNRSKSDKTPLEWQPPKNNCFYLSKYVAVKQRYKLSIDTAILKLRDSTCRQSIKTN